MKALVLAGGSGSRLRPLTHTSAKQLIPVGNKPVLFYGLEAIAETGIREVGIVVGETANEVREAVGDGSRFGLNATYLSQPRPLGLAHAVQISRSYLANEPFVMYLGDNFLLGGIKDAARSFQQKNSDVHLLLTSVEHPELFGVVKLDDKGKIVEVVEKPSHPVSNLAVTGIYFFSPSIHKITDNLRPSTRGELEISDAIQQMITNGSEVTSSMVSGYWKDTGSVDSMLEVNRLVLERLIPQQGGCVQDSEVSGRVIIEDGAVIRNSHIVGPAIIATDTVIVDSYIGPFTSISNGCRISGSEIQCSIVMRGSRIENTRRIEHSLIGRDTLIAPSLLPRTSHQLVIGDHSQLLISS